VDKHGRVVGFAKEECMLSKRTVNHRLLGSVIAQILVFLPLGALFVEAQGTSPRVKGFKHDRDVETAFVWGSPPRWEGNGLIGYVQNHTSAPVVFTIDREGRRDETLLRFPDVSLMNLVDISASRGGEIAVIGSAYTSDGRSTAFVGRVSADRQHQTVTRVWPYCPMAVTFAADGTIWTIGHLKDDENTTIRAYSVLRRFDASGRMLGSTNVSLAERTTQGLSHLRSSTDRVGWLTHGLEYIEFSLDGNEIARYDRPEGASDRNITGLAISDENEVVIGRFGHENTGLLVLDRSSRTWNALSVPKEQVPSWVDVKGFDGKMLVTTTRNGTIRRFTPE
jgi:hypothetical protein